jgi:hypothetical protein
MLEVFRVRSGMEKQVIDAGSDVRKPVCHSFYESLEADRGPNEPFWCCNPLKLALAWNHEGSSGACSWME